MPDRSTICDGPRRDLPGRLMRQYLSRSVIGVTLCCAALLGAAFVGCGGATEAQSGPDHTTTGAPHTTADPDEATVAEVVMPSDASPPALGNGPIEDITFDDLKLDMPLGTLFDASMLSPRVKELDGRRVRLKGFIYAGGVYEFTGLKSFPFVMNSQCKFGPSGYAYCVILVELDEGVEADYTMRPVTVEGTLTVKPLNAQGCTWSVYHMQGQKVR